MIADRFKWTLQDIKALSFQEHEVLMGYIERHQIDPMMHLALAKIAVINSRAQGADLNLDDLFPEYKSHREIPRHLISVKAQQELAEAERQAELEKQRIELRAMFGSLE